MIFVYGSSDDLIEIEGDIREEFTLQDREFIGDLLAFSNGVVLRVSYQEDGIWRITPLVHSEKVKVVFATDAETVYSDKATISGYNQWVVHGVSWAKLAPHA